MASAQPMGDSVPGLRELVRRHQMTFETHRDLAVVGQQLETVGFTVELTAVLDHAPHPLSPGCAACAPVMAALRRVCFAALPRGEHASWFDVHVDSAFVMDPRRHGTPELSATIEILHEGVVNRPSDEDERACLAEIRARLHELDVPQVGG